MDHFFSQPFGQSSFSDSGHGRPLLLLNGLGFSSWSWTWQQDNVPETRLISLDNRGVGRSDLGEGDFSIADLADDAARLLDHLEVGEAAIFGVSLGGLIAQEFALRHPSRCRGLILGCTFGGGDDTVAMSAATAETMANLAQLGWTETSVRAALNLNFSPEWQAGHPADVERYVALRTAHAPLLRAWLAQRQAGAAAAPGPRLSGYSGPALLLHGGRDEVVPPANLQKLAGRLPQAELHVYSEARHLFWIEEAAHLNLLLSQFVARCGTRG